MPTYKSSSIVVPLSPLQVVALIDAVEDVLSRHQGRITRLPPRRAQLLVLTQDSLIKLRDAEVVG